jgi:phosphatidylglycerophosphate synthase
MTPVTAGTHARENLGVLARSEKQLLIWIARRLPDLIGSDHLSALGLIAMAFAGLSFAAYRVTPWAACGVVVSLTANWLGDSLDGTVARVRDQQRPRYGFYVDHVIDIAGTTCLMAGMACSGLMNPLVGLAVLCVFLMVSAESYLATHAAGVFRMSFFGFGPTELRIVIAAGAIKAARSPWAALGPLTGVKLFDVGGAVAIVGLTAAFVAASIRNISALYRAEPLPAHGRKSRAV